MNDARWQGIVQYWRADTMSAYSEGYGRSWWWFLHWDEYPILFCVARDYLNILGRQYRIPLPTRWSNAALATKMKWSRFSARAVSSFRISIIVLHLKPFVQSCACILDLMLAL